jgi:hypothetical protein
MMMAAPMTSYAEHICYTLADFFDQAESMSYSAPVAMTEQEQKFFLNTWNNSPPVDQKFPDYDSIYSVTDGIHVQVIAFQDGCSIGALVFEVEFYEGLITRQHDSL